MRPIIIVLVIVVATGLSYALGIAVGRPPVRVSRGDFSVSAPSAVGRAGGSASPQLRGFSEDELLPLIATTFGSRRNAAAVADWLRRRRDGLTGLAVIAGDKTCGLDARLFAIAMLGELRCDSAVPELVENVDWQQPVEVIMEASPLNGHPCAMSLHEIGLNCVPYLIHRLARYEPSDVTDQMIKIRVYLLLEIYARGPSVSHPVREAVALTERIIERSGSGHAGNPSFSPFVPSSQTAHDGRGILATSGASFGGHLPHHLKGRFHRQNLERLLQALREPGR